MSGHSGILPDIEEMQLKNLEGIMTAEDTGPESRTAHSSSTVFSSGAIAYLSIRRFVGIVALLLPCVLLLFGGAQRTISSYYHSGLRDVFVGAMCAVAMFLFFEHIPLTHNVSTTFRRWNNLTGNVAAIAAVGVALVPTIREGESPNWQSCVHVAASILFFLCLAIFSLYLFRKDRICRAGWRNRMHLVSGLIIVAMAVAAIIGGIQRANIFWFEAIAVQAFGFSWILKGESRRGFASATPETEPEDRAEGAATAASDFSLAAA